MGEISNECDIKVKSKYVRHHNHGGQAVCGLGFIGAAVYFIGEATTFGAGVVGFFKAIFWPAFLVYEAFNAVYK
jgi:hypothetical protein